MSFSTGTQTGLVNDVMLVEQPIAHIIFLNFSYIVSINTFPYKSSQYRIQLDATEIFSQSTKKKHSSYLHSLERSISWFREKIFGLQ